MFTPMPNGEIQLITGCMFAGKSTELLRRVEIYESAKNKVLCVKYSHDIRYSETGICTHDKQHKKATVCLDLLHLEDVVLCNYDVIAIDEGQFFAGLISFCIKWSTMGKVILVAALDGTFEKKPFGEVCNLMPLCDNVVKLFAKCFCKRNASFSKRIIQDSNEIVIGGSDKYIAVCRNCFNK